MIFIVIGPSLEEEQDAKIRYLENQKRQLDTEAARIDQAKAAIKAQKLRIQQGNPDPAACNTNGWRNLSHVF